MMSVAKIAVFCVLMPCYFVATFWKNSRPLRNVETNLSSYTLWGPEKTIIWTTHKISMWPVC